LTKETKRVLTHQKLYSTIFKISQVVADPFIALAFIFSPFGIKHQNGINFGPLTQLPHQNLQLRVKGNKSTKMNLE
jgi:tetrahydromethanopterin S-methyltransferase subunit C